MEVTLAEFVLCVLLVCLGLVGFFTLVSRVSRRGVELRAVRHRIICRLCLHPFEDHSSEKTPSCPACGALNERGRDRRLG